jgi:hypothetical protein
LPEESRGDLLGSTASLVERTTNIWTDSSYFAEREGRTVELALLSNRMTLWDWVFGQGLGASWNDSLIYDGDRRFMVHVGYFMLIFSGGVLNLLLFGFGPLLSGVQLFLRRPHTAVAFASCAVLLERIVRMFYFGAPDATLDFVLLCICFAFSVGQVRVTRASGKDLRVDASGSAERVPT